MKKIIKNLALFTFVFASYACNVHAFPHTIIFENKTDKPQVINITSTYTVRHAPTKSKFRNEPEIISKTLPAYTSFTFGSNNHQFITLVIKTYGSLVTGLGKLGPVAKIELLKDDQIKISSASYFEQTKLSAIAAKEAVAQRFANTRAWLSDIWTSITTIFAKVANFFKPSSQPNIKIVNECNFPILFGNVCTFTLLGYNCKPIILRAKNTITYPFTVFRSDSINIQTANIQSSTVTTRLEQYKNEMAQHPGDELVITIKGLKNTKWDIEIDWQKKEKTKTATGIAQKLMPPTPHVPSQQEASVTWPQILRGNIGDEYQQKAETIGMTYPIKADVPDFKAKLKTLFFTKDSNGKIISYNQVPIKDAKEQIDETIRILNKYKTQGWIQ